MASSRMSISEVIDNLDSGDFDDLMAEGSDDDIGMDVDYDWLRYFRKYYWIKYL